MVVVAEAAEEDAAEVAGAEVAEKLALSPNQMGSAGESVVFVELCREHRVS